MSAALAAVLKTDRQAERALIFTEHIRLRCNMCGVIVQPSELEKALWADSSICPSCIQGEELQSGCNSAFDDVLYEQDKALQNKIYKLTSELAEAKASHAKMIKDVKDLTAQYSWVSKARISEIEFWLELVF